MHYYQKNIGDYYKKAGRLSILQHGAYTLLIDSCYDRERFPTMSEAIEWTWASTTEEIEAVKFVLSKFFELKVDKYVQPRIESELEKYKITGLINQLIAYSREARKKNRNSFAIDCDQLRAKIKNDPLSKSHAAWSDVIEALVKQHETAPNHKPITNNHKPITNKKKTPPKAKLDYEKLFSEFWDMWPKRGDTRKTAFDKFKTKCKKMETYDQIINGLKTQLPQFRECENKFIPAASTWLNQERWNNEPEIKKQSGGMSW